MGLGTCSYCGSIHHDSEDCPTNILTREQGGEIARLKADLAAVTARAVQAEQDRDKALGELRLDEAELRRIRPHRGVPYWYATVEEWVAQAKLNCENAKIIDSLRAGLAASQSRECAVKESLAAAQDKSYLDGAKAGWTAASASARIEDGKVAFPPHPWVVRRDASVDEYKAALAVLAPCPHQQRVIALAAAYSELMRRLENESSAEQDADGRIHCNWQMLMRDRLRLLDPAADLAAHDARVSTEARRKALEEAHRAICAKAVQIEERDGGHFTWSDAATLISDLSGQEGGK
jgi:hypothetical protein